MTNTFDCLTTLTVGGETVHYFSLPALTRKYPGVERLPYSLKILLENLLRREDASFVKADDIKALAGWTPSGAVEKEISFMPARVLLQDFTGVPCVVDLAAMRDGIAALGGDPEKVNPLQPVELVIDHSVQVDHFGSANAFQLNADLEYHRNRERYVFLRWGQTAFSELPRRSARNRHRPSGQHRVSRARRLQGPEGRQDRAVSRHGLRHRLAHDDGERPGRRGLGRGRDRGGGRDARPAELDADSGRRRLPAGRQAARRRNRHRPRADDHRGAAQEGRRRQVRGVLRARPRAPDDRRPRDAREHVPRIRRHGRDFPNRRHDARLPAAHGPRRLAGRARRGLRACAGALPDRPDAGRALQRHAGARSRVRRPEPGRSAASAGPRRPLEGAHVVCRGAARAAEGREEGRRRWRRSSGRGGDAVGARLGRHRGDHELHEHVEPERDDRRRPRSRRRRSRRASRRSRG